MAFTSYTTFIAVVADYLARTDLTSQIPDFVNLAQNRMSRDLRVRQMLKVATTDTTGGDSTIALPADFLELREMHITGNPPKNLEFQTPDLFFRNGQIANSGLPTKFTILATEFQFSPAPDGTYTVQMLYYAKPTFISSSTSSNLFLAYFQDALLYATLGEAEPYLLNDARTQTWSALYDRAISNIISSDLGGTYPSTSLNVTTQ